MALSARDILEKLVSFPSVSSESNIPIATWIHDYLKDHGIDVHLVPASDPDKINLIAQTGPNVDGGIVLSGHMDVVPVEGQDWGTDPFQLIEQDGRLYGRGSCDMKGFVALAIKAMVDASRRDLKRPLQLALSRDEEVGLLGAPEVAQGLLDTYAKAAGVLIGEPTKMGVVTGHKSCDAIKVHVHGYEVHSSDLYRGASAIHYAAQLVEWVRLQSMANRNAPRSDIATLYNPPFTTLHVGMIQGGTAANITAKDCSFSIDVRCVGDDSFDPWVDRIKAKAAELETEMQAVHPDTGITITTIPGPGVAPEPDGRAEVLARRVTGDNSVRTVAYGTDGGWFQKMGFSTVICGPGSIEQAHQPNEFLEISQFNAGGAMLTRVIETLEQDT